ncbi:hypothetical protein PRUPE_2G130900, partial [Prunus persica]
QFSCREEESSALLQFKKSFIIDKSASSYDGAYPKVSAWKLGGGGNSSCCSWDGVECDEKTGHVIGLDLSSSYLYGSIHSNSSLFSLVHLQRLNLSDNNFNYSQIPSSIRNFPNLTQLDLSASVFAGQVPYEVSQLSKLTSLNLCCNLETSSSEGLLKLQPSDMRSLVHNLTSLEILQLNFVSISSTVPESLANLTFLTFLALRECDLVGEFPVRIFNLPNLKSLSVRYNQDLTGYFPEFNRSSPLVLLKVAFTANKFVGSIPDSLANLTKLTVCRINSNPLTGPIPSWLGNFTKLIYLDLSFNSLNGSIPTSFSNLMNLELLYLHGNHLSGVVKLEMFQKLQNLYELQLNWNNLEFVTESKITNATVQQFTVLSLSACNIREFPSFLRYQTNLERLDLSRNKLHGQVPKWMWNISTETLVYMDISENFLSDQLPFFLPWVNLLCLRLSSNMFHGPVPIPPPSMLEYRVPENKFSGEISPLLCHMSSLRYLDLSKNNLSGTLPQCLGNFSDGLILLLLRRNSFHGIVPQSYSNRSSLRMIDVSHNQLQGRLPRSLANCLMLEYLVLSNNQFSDAFPIWLGTLPELKLLAMRQNAFSGVIGNSRKNLDFPKLRIVDLSYNNFTGEIPSVFPDSTVNNSDYMHTDVTYNANDFLVIFSVDYSITIATKGLDLYYSKIQEEFASFDISSNKFEGQIPEFIGNLTELHSLNISNNILTGSIPSSLGKLTKLESLDLSRNKLSGQIPQQLTQLNFLGNLDVSHNNLTGRIPQGTQLTSFNSTSYEGNPGLCGDPLPRKCGDPEAPRQPSSLVEENDSGSAGTLELDWRFGLAGYGSGMVVGVVLADFVISRRHELYVKIVAKIRLKIWKR